MLYSDLIDRGEPYLSRVARFRDLRIDTGALIATASRRVSVGELIAHQLPHNNLADIDANLSVLLAEDFSAEFQKDLVHEDMLGGHQVFQKYLRRFIVDTFKQRHIFCHELATVFEPKRDQIHSTLQLFRVFILMIEEHIAVKST